MTKIAFYEEQQSQSACYNNVVMALIKCKNIEENGYKSQNILVEYRGF